MVAGFFFLVSKSKPETVYRVSQPNQKKHQGRSRSQALGSGEPPVIPTHSACESCGSVWYGASSIH